MIARPARAADQHVPVLRERVVELLAPALQSPGAVLVDATLGMGGHTEALLEACPQTRVIGIDRDPDALRLAGERLEPYGERFVGVQAVYDQLGEVLADEGAHEVQAVLFDLGVSSLQLDQADRGFAYRLDTPLDMRMGDAGPTAADLLNTLDAADLERILKEYGEERFARRVAREIVREREQAPFATSGRLVEVLRRAIPAASQRTGGHPAKRTFQALRIEVNDELGAWERALPQAVDALAVDGRVAVLSYHSLEDRIAKRVLTSGARSTTPADLPVELPEHAPYLRLLTRGGERPTEQETHLNPRAASAVLRAAVRTRQTKGPRS